MKVCVSERDLLAIVVILVTDRQQRIAYRDATINKEYKDGYSSDLVSNDQNIPLAFKFHDNRLQLNDNVTI
jgi:hypothetical protein